MRPPGFRPDLDNDPWWEALAAHAVVVQACSACGRHRLPRMPACPWCAVPGGEDVAVPGTGTVYSFVRVHRALTEEREHEVPYAIATVDLDGGARVFGRVHPASDTAVGARVAPVFVDHDGWTELRFVRAT